MGEMSVVKKAHAVCIPSPAQSHITAMLNLAKLLHHKGFHVTYVHTDYNYNRLLRSRGPDSVAGPPGFEFRAIPDGLPPPAPGNDDVTQDVFQLSISTHKSCHAPFLELLNSLNDKEGSPPVTCIVADVFMSFALQAAEELAIPAVQSWTVSAMSAMAFIHLPHLKERGYTPLKDESCFKNGHMDQTIDWIPGTGSIRLRDIPTILWTTDPGDAFFQYMLDVMTKSCKSSATIINTFEALEPDVVTAFSTLVDRIYTIGPIHALAKQIRNEETNSVAMESIKSNLWKEDGACIEWLDSKEKGSVVYVNFGSITVMNNDQLIEFALGLANSKHHFLWIIRPDLVPGGAVLPPEFLKLTEKLKRTGTERGMLAGWCNQEAVLDHPAVGAFLTHCGWNSVLESLSAGVPMICWPFFSDQQTNCMCVCSRWGVGMEIDSNVDREQVQRVVIEVMEGDGGKEIKSKALEWKKSAEEAIRPGVGSSYCNLDKLIEEVLLKPKNKSYA